MAVKVHLGQCDMAVACFYVHCVHRWNTAFVTRLVRRLQGVCVICGDFNSHYTPWSSDHTDCRGRYLLDTTTGAGLLIINTDCQTFKPRGIKSTARDLSPMSDHCQYEWKREADTFTIPFT